MAAKFYTENEFDLDFVDPMDEVEANGMIAIIRNLVLMGEETGQAFDGFAGLTIDSDIIEAVATF